MYVCEASSPPFIISPGANASRGSGLAASLLRALGDEGSSVTAKKLREQIERLEQEAVLRGYDDDDEEELMVSNLP